MNPRHPAPSETALVTPTELADSFHHIANAVAAARSYSEILRARARAGAFQHPEPILDDLVAELDRLGALVRAARTGYLLEAADALESILAEIAAPARSAASLLEVLKEEAATADATGRAPAGLRDLGVLAARRVARVRAIASAARRSEDDPTPPVDVDGLLDQVLTSDSAQIVRERSALVLREGPLPAARADAGTLAEIFAALIHDAVARNPTPFPEVEIGGRTLPGGGREYWIRDNAPVPVPGERARGRAGLAVSRALASTLGGRIEVEIPPLRDGTVVRLALPGALQPGG